MKTKPSNTVCDHDWQPDPWEPGMQTCGWECGATREAPAVARELDDTHVVMVIVEARRAA